MVARRGLADQSLMRTMLRVVGVLSMGVALLCAAVAIADFFRAVNDPSFDAAPTKFWLFFVALPFFAVGAFCLQAGFLGLAARFTAGETMPVAKDSLEFLTDGKGLRNLGRAEADPGPFCRRCGTRNDGDARFCDGCGESLS